MEQHKEIKQENKEEKKIVEAQSSEKKEERRIKKESAIINGRDLPISTKHAIYFCNYIRGKKIEDAIEMVNNVLIKKEALPMKGEVPHRHGMKGKIQIGRYPEKASKEFLRLLKSLNSNSSVNGINNPVIFRAIANQASKPFRRFGQGRFKRTHVYLESREFVGGK